MGINVTYALPCYELKEIPTKNIALEMKWKTKLEEKQWNLNIKGVDIIAYTSWFNDLATMCPTLLTQKSKNIKRYIWGLDYQIQGHVTSLRPTRFDSYKCLTFNLTN